MKGVYEKELGEEIVMKRKKNEERRIGNGKENKREGGVGKERV